MKPPERHESRVLRQECLAPGAYELVLDRCGMDFAAGKEIQVHGADHTEDRSYSIASSEADPELKLLYRVVEKGILTPKLEALQPGDPLAFTGPFGSFVLRDAERPMLFIATGTGIAPALSFLRTHPDMQATILHGVRTVEDLFYREELERTDYHPCISGDAPDEYFRGRVTDHIKSMAIPDDAHIYLCGANPMILAVHKYLCAEGVEESRIFSEAYYFW